VFFTSPLKKTGKLDATRVEHFPKDVVDEADPGDQEHGQLRRARIDQTQ